MIFNLHRTLFFPSCCRYPAVPARSSWGLAAAGAGLAEPCGGAGSPPPCACLGAPGLPAAAQQPPSSSQGDSAHFSHTHTAALSVLPIIAVVHEPQMFAQGIDRTLSACLLHWVPQHTPLCLPPSLSLTVFSFSVSLYPCSAQGASSVKVIFQERPAALTMSLWA